MADMKSEYRRKNTFWKNWGAVFILLAFFIASWGGQLVAQLESEKQKSQQHGQEFKMDEFWPQFWGSTLENLQSEWLQLMTQAVLISAFSAYIFRKQDEEHFKTHLMIEELRNEIRK